MLSVTKVFAGRGAVDYYLAQQRDKVADYYLPEHIDPGTLAGRARSAPNARWWGGGSAALDLSEGVERADFEPLYGHGVRPDGSRLGTRFRTDKDAAAARYREERTADFINDAHDRWQARHALRTGTGKASVAAWDCTFSPVKSVSLLWAGGDDQVQRQVWAAHTSAVDAGLVHLEEHGAYVRAGRNGVRVHDSTGLVVARINEWTSRDGDPQLHTHCVVLNRAQTGIDGKWRALDGRELLAAKPAAGAIYNRTLEAELTRRLGVGWRDRPDGLREIVGIDDQLIDVFSSRRRSIGPEVDRLVAAYRDEHGTDPAPKVRWAIAQQATLATRRRKTTTAGDTDREWEQVARDADRSLTTTVLTALHRERPKVRSPGEEDQVDTLLAHVGDSDRTTFTRHDLLRLALDVVQPGVLSPAELRAAAERLVDHTLRRPDLLTITTPDPISAPDELRRRDGTSVYERPGRQRWALDATLDREAWLLDTSREPTGLTSTSDTIARVARRAGLGPDQTVALNDLLTDDRRISLLLGPAGTGKTRTLKAVVHAWHTHDRPVVGLTVSQSAAEVLADETGLITHNVAKWLHETRRSQWRFAEGTLVIIDEATMIGTADLVEVIDQVRRARGRAVLVGDPAQLGAIDAGGMFQLLADRNGAAELHEIRRFTEPWEARASRALRRRDPQAIAAYAMRARLHDGTLVHLQDELVDAWHADTLAPTPDGVRPHVLMIATTNEQARALAERARARLVRDGLVASGPTTRLSDSVASVGDHILTRRNERMLSTSDGGWVVNGDTWTVLHVHPSGSVDVRRHRDDATTTLPVEYLAADTQLGYATTVHRAQGTTVDRCHALITSECTHEALYVATTRGRDANHIWVAADPAHTHGSRNDVPAEQVLTAILRRHDPARLSAHQVIEHAQHQHVSLARLTAVHDDATGRITEQWLADQVKRIIGPSTIAHDPHWPALVARIRRISLDGHDPEALLRDAIDLAPLDDARSLAAVLHWRLGELASPHPAAAGPRAIPQATTPDGDVARQTADLIDQRLAHLRAGLTHLGGTLPWAPSLGMCPSDPHGSARWLDAALAITAYREQCSVPDHIEMLGERPTGLRPQAQAAFDRALNLSDAYLATRLHRLTDDERRDLRKRQQAIIDERPTFDPAALDDARRNWDTARRNGTTAADDEVRRRVVLLERRAVEFDDWTSAVTKAIDILRHLEIDGQRAYRPVAMRRT